MKTASLRLFVLLLTMLLLLPVFGGDAVLAVETTIQTIQVMPDQSFYRPGEAVRWTATASAESTIRRFDVRVTYLDEVIAAFDVPADDGQAAFEWTPPNEAPRGYGLIVDGRDEAGNVVATTSTAFDVLNHWINAPRYGFLSDFSAGRTNDDETIAWMLRHHINGVQFYDWQHRWEDLLPETDQFSDGLGRPQSMTTIRRLIDLLHRHKIAAMPYTAIYGASMAFYRQHPDWALFDALGDAYLFGGDLIGIMNPAPGSAWNTHLMSEYADVLDNTAFDGIHIDQYGAPKNGFDSEGNPIDLAVVMPQFIDQTAALVQDRRGDEGVTLFNSVGNWPIDAVAPADQDASYIEVWSPYDDYLDLNRIITNAQQLGNGKPVILAAYIPPDRSINWRLANAVIAASGAFHLETGEPGAMLADPYFPLFGAIPAEQQAQFTRYYDFIVRYENVLSLGTTAAASERHSAVELGEVRTRGIRSKDRVVPIVRAGAGFETFSLINFLDIDNSSWNAATTVEPTALIDVAVTIPVDRPVASVWYASPDNAERMNAVALPFTVEAGVLRFTLPRLDYWSMIVVEYENE